MIFRGAARFAAGLALAACSLAAGPGMAIEVVDSSVSPAACVTVGTVISITATLNNDSGLLGKLRASQTLLAIICDSATVYGMDGDYTVFPDSTSLVTSPSASSTMIDFNYGTGVTQVVRWTFTAAGAGVVNFSIVADDDLAAIAEGCDDPAGCGYSGLPSDSSTCAFVTVTIVEPEIGVTVYVDPDGAGATYSAGPEVKIYSTTKDEVWVIATLTNSGGSDYYVDPDCVPDDIWTWSPNPDFMLSAVRTPAGPVLLASGGGSRTFTWKYVVDRSEYFSYCRPSYPYGWKVREGVDLVGKWTKNTMEVVNSPLVMNTQSTDSLVRGEIITATLYGQNGAPRGIVLDESATPYMDVGGTPLVTLLSGPASLPPLAISSGATALFTWTYSATGSGVQYFDGGMLYRQAPCPSGGVDATLIMAPIPFLLDMQTTKSTVNDLETYHAVLSLYNPTAASKYIDAVTLNENPFGYAPRPGPPTCPECPSLPCTVPDSATAYFTWTVAGGICGTMNWSGTLTGRDEVEGFTRIYWSDDIAVRSRANFELDAAFTSSTIIETQSFGGVVYVTPNGMNDAVGFSITLTAHASPGATIIEVTPASVPVTMTGCGTCVTSPCLEKTLAYTWVYQAVSRGLKGTPAMDVGKVWFTFTVSGVDEYDSTPVEKSYTIPLTSALQILRPSVISVSLFTVQGSASGCPLNVVGVVAADGNTLIDSFTLSLTGTSVCSGTPDASLYAIPAATGILGTGGDFFTWTFSPTAAGDIRFTVSVTGVEIGLGLYSEAKASTAECYQISPTFVSVSVWHDVSNGVKTTMPGQYYNVYMRVRNDGDIRLDSVDVCAAPANAACTGASCTGTVLGESVLVNSVLPDVSGGILSCTEKIFAWRMTTTGTGCAALTVSVTGVDADSGAPIYASAATTCLSIVERPPVAVRIASGPGTVMRGRTFEVVVEMVNSGLTTVRVSKNVPPVFVAVPGLSYADLSFAYLDVAPGQSRTLTYTFTVSPDAPTGTTGFSLAAAPFKAADLTASGSVPVSTDTAAFSFTVIPAETTLTLTKNPFHPLKGGLPIHFTISERGKVVIKVYSITGELVKTVLDEEREAGEYTLLWDGRNSDAQTIAAGIYVLRFESKGLKSTRKLAVIK